MDDTLGVPLPSPEWQESHPGWNATAAAQLGIWDAGTDDYVIPPRGWLLGTSFCRRFLSSILADGGVGKTAVRIAQLISLAIGPPAPGRKSLTDEHVFLRCRVLILSLEDDRDELRRRVYAVLKYHGISPADVEGWLFLSAPRGLRLAEMGENSPQLTDTAELLKTAIDELHIDVVSIDPFVKSHGVGENDNSAIDFVCTELATIAIEKNCAVDTPHHTSKGIAVAGDASKGRGASAMVDAGRLVHTLTPMTEEEAKQFGVDEGERKSLRRMDSGKVNIAPPSREAKWFQLVGVDLGNVSATYPHGDNVQTVIPWTPPDAWDGLDHHRLNRILTDIDAGPGKGQKYSAAPSAKGDRAAWTVVSNHSVGKSEAACRDIIKAWVKSGTLIEAPYHDPVASKERLGLSVDQTKRPT